MTSTVRAATAADRAGLQSLAIESGLLTPDESSLLVDAFDEDFVHDQPLSGVWLISGAARVEGGAYCVPELAGDNAWNLLFLAVLPECRNQGRARELLEVTREEVQRRGARLLLVETSSTAAQAPARRLYERMGFTIAGTIPDYYADGDSKVIFSRRI